MMVTLLALQVVDIIFYAIAVKFDFYEVFQGEGYVSGCVLIGFFLSYFENKINERYGEKL